MGAADATLGAVPARSTDNPVGETAQPLPGARTATTGLSGKKGVTL